MGYSISFGEATEAGSSGHLLMCAWSFQREKIAKGQTLHPDSDLY